MFSAVLAAAAVLVVAVLVCLRQRAPEEHADGVPLVLDAGVRLGDRNGGSHGEFGGPGEDPLPGLPAEQISLRVVRPQRPVGCVAQPQPGTDPMQITSRS